MMKIISFLTDFGSSDGYVAAVKGTILSLCPQANIVDITHQITPFRVDEAAFCLFSCYRDFPEGSIHLVVVDPGVGSDRAGLIVKTAKYYFVAPDNGILSYIYQFDSIRAVVKIENAKYYKDEVSSTFHGRDIFGPVAAHLLNGIDMNQIGAIQNLDKLVQIPLKQPTEEECHVIHVDHFGNIILNVTRSHFKDLAKTCLKVKGGELIAIYDHYYQVPSHQIGALFGSSGYLEITCCESNAQQLLQLKVGSEISIVNHK